MINNKSTLEQVKEFHEVFGHPVAEKVGDETLEVRQLRIKLLFEELQELAEATDCKATFINLCDDLGNGYLETYGEGEKNFEVNVKDGNNVDHVAELDALCDLQVVLDGKFLTSGHWKVKDEAFAEVHRSNMSKSSDASTISDSDIIDHAFKVQTEKNLPVVNAENKFGRIVWVRSDGKILKGPDFSEPDLKQFVK